MIMMKKKNHHHRHHHQRIATPAPIPSTPLHTNPEIPTRLQITSNSNATSYQSQSTHTHPLNPNQPPPPPPLSTSQSQPQQPTNPQPQPHPHPHQSHSPPNTNQSISHLLATPPLRSKATLFPNPVPQNNSYHPLAKAHPHTHSPHLKQSNLTKKKAYCTMLCTELQSRDGCRKIDR